MRRGPSTTACSSAWRSAARCRSISGKTMSEPLRGVVVSHAAVAQALLAAVAAITGVSIALFRIDDRLIHGQVVVGWGKPLNVGFIVLVDDAVRASAWEQELYRMGVPADIEVVFASTAEAAQHLTEWESDKRVGILVSGEIDTLAALSGNGHPVRRVNLGGVHHPPGRSERLRYVYLTDAEAAQLRALAAQGVEGAAQDVPTAPAAPLKNFT